MSPTVATPATTSVHTSSNSSAKADQRGIPTSSHPSCNASGETRLGSLKSKQSTTMTSAASSKPSSAASTMATAKKKKKRSSPFRIKAGCIVALRYRSGGNHVRMVSPDGTVQKMASASSHSEVWVDPMPGRDEGFALVGKRIRCCFPKSVLLEQKGRKAASSRILEGEIISLVDYETQWRLQRKRRRQRDPCGMTVELLVDKASLASMPFLKRTDEVLNTAKMSDTEKKRLRYEEIIKGENKVTVQVMLGDACRILKTADKKSLESQHDTVARWVIRKRVPLPLVRPLSEEKNKNGKEKNGAKRGGKTDEKHKSTPDTETADRPAKRQKTEVKKSSSSAMTRYVGDGNDSPALQERNWRWMVGRYDDLHLLEEHASCAQSLGCFSAGFIGEVLSVTPSAKLSSTLATVTIRRIVIPEQTRNGRMSDDGPFDFFDDYESVIDDSKVCSEGTDIVKGEPTPNSAKTKLCTFQVPVEELVIISRRFERELGAKSLRQANFKGFPVIRESYSSRDNRYRALLDSDNKSVSSVGANPSGGESDPPVKVCHRCRRTTSSAGLTTCSPTLGEQDSTEANQSDVACCPKCVRSIYSQSISGGVNGDSSRCFGSCDCRCCVRRRNAESVHAFTKWLAEAGKMDHPMTDSAAESSQFADASSVMRVAPSSDFFLPPTFMGLSSLPTPSESPILQVKKRGTKSRSKGVDNRDGSGTRNKSRPIKKLTTTPRSVKSNNMSDKSPGPSEEERVFKPTCCRLLPYDAESKTFSGIPKQQATRKGSEDIAGGKAVRGSARHNVRSRGKAPDRPEKKSTSRAARANQRRMMKDVATFGQTGLGLDTLAGREQQLRFDKSLIHAWGVFADEGINTGEMIIEYRGELIGNSVAEKREQEYEKAKIGSDYMFRIDSNTVCDATKQGNVARFINASCSPNCYTQIITLNGVKRIVIYAKRDIQAGEELCYDYKFPLEYDETRRIICYCGAPDCRGFMNWDKKYVSLSPPKGGKSDPSKEKDLYGKLF